MIRELLDADLVHYVNYGSIAKAADLSKESLVYLLKQVMMAVQSATRKEYQVKLNLRIGFLKIRNGQLSFDNVATAKEIDQLTQSSCNTNFRANKYNMTHFGTKPNVMEDQSYHSESIRDQLSRISQPKTPRSISISLKSHNDILAARADPNTIDLKMKAREARLLNTLVEGKYSKRMSINGKDNYHIPEMHRSV